MEFLVSWSSSTVDSCSMSAFKFVQQLQQKIKFAKVVVEKANFVMELHGIIVTLLGKNLALCEGR